MCRDTLASLP
jgi:hypothetical protein